MSWDGEGRRPYRDKKQEKARLRRLTLALLQLKSLQFMQPHVEEELYEKCLEAVRIKDHFVARRRAERRIVELLRHCEQEVIDFLEASLNQADTLAAQREERVLRQKEHLLHGGKEEFTRFVDRYPKVNIQRIRQLIRNAAREGEEGGKSTKSLEKLIRECFIEGDQ